MYYLTHDKAGHQVFLLKEDSDINTIKEDIEEGAIAYAPADGIINIRIGGEWVEASTGGGGQPIISDDVDFNGYSIENLNELYAEFIAISDSIRFEANNDFLDVGANDGEGDYTAPVHLTGLSPNPTYANEAVCKSYADKFKNNWTLINHDGLPYGNNELVFDVPAGTYLAVDEVYIDGKGSHSIRYYDNDSDYCYNLSLAQLDAPDGLATFTCLHCDRQIGELPFILVATLFDSDKLYVKKIDIPF